MTPPSVGPAPFAGPAPDRRYLLLIPLAALFVVHPLIVHGCSCGHDIDFHLLSWIEAAQQIAHGNLHPHWAFTPAFNAGEPRFVFYPPLSWYLGALLGLILTHLPGVSEAAAWSAVPILFTWIALTASGFAMHRLARAFATPTAALLAATFYLANPYMLFTAYERSAYGELLAAAWIPLLFLGILRERVTVRGITVPIALLWLTNAPAAVMGSYTLAFLAALRLATNPRLEPALEPPKGLRSETWVSRHQDSLQLALKTIAGFSLGLALAAVYVIPAASERRFVQISMATITGMRIDQNFLFEHTGSTPDDLDHDQVLHTASLLAVILLVATAVTLLAVFLRRKRRDQTPFPAFALTILTFGIAFLLTPWSAPIWRHAPETAFLQFPWRLLAILAPILALALAELFSHRFLKAAAAAAIAFSVLALLTLPAYHVFRQACDPEDTAPARVALFHSNSGTDPTDEYTPTTADNDALKPNDPPYWLAASPTAPPPVETQPGPTPTRLTLTALRAEFLILNLRDYPAWHIALNGAPGPPRVQRTDGLIAIPIPAGPSTIDVRYAHTPDQTLGDAITIFALLILLSLLFMRRTQSTPCATPPL